jgi:Flp pilus assembly protein TadG
MVLAMVVLIGMTGVIVDGGNAWANSRAVQNGADAAAEAGAIVLARRLAGAITPSGGWDASVQTAVRASATANAVDLQGVYYTDICGIPLKADGTASLNADGTYKFDTAKPVGSGLPTPTNTTPDCPSLTVGPVAGVIVLAGRDVGTYFSSVLGLRTIPITMQATAAAGFLQESCAAPQGEACGMLPIAFPVNQVSCTNTNSVIDTGIPWSADGVTVYVVPLCSNSPGNVGWVDWSPKAGGTNELIASITDPSNPAVPLPSWQYITSTGNVNAIGLENAIRAYDGQTVLVPEFDLTCNPGPNADPDSTAPAINTAPNFGCPAGAMGGAGANQWYRVPSFAHFRLCDATNAACLAKGADHGAYLTGGAGSGICNSASGATSCLVGTFESVIRTGTIGAGVGGGTGNSKTVGIQLIK